MAAPKLRSEKVFWIRKVIALYSIILVVCVGYPWFLYTTSVHRANLPIDDLNDAIQQLNNVRVCTSVFVDAEEDFISQAQLVLDSKLATEHPALNDYWSLKLIPLVDSTILDSREDYQVLFGRVDEPVGASSVTLDDKVLVFEKSFSEMDSRAIQEQLADALVNEVFEQEIEHFEATKSSHPEKSNVVIPYSSKYNLIFSLFVEDGHPVSWDTQTIQDLLSPLLDSLQHYANFTISTQVQYYSKLNIKSEFDEKSNTYKVKESDLSNFINFGDWNLNTNDINPSINFIIYYPSSNHQNLPMVIENSETNSFLVPQYGGLHIFNKKIDILTDDNEVYICDVELIEIMEIFSSQLFKLLGVPSKSSQNLPVRVDALTKLSILNNLQHSIKTLSSLIKLTNELHEISVPELTKDFVNKSLQSVRTSIHYLMSQNFKGAMVESSIALKNSISAFFDKDIVQQVYFPSEHKLAVFLPLLGPLCSILLFSTLRLIKELRK
ncbi:hypothetical protein CANTEDRAFT_113394 [Yamadazyma tenuis ATCC 10573]|uniref:GPI transamidase component PIG-S n=2 Tax=Candida tenuis TaxID=2315449 RepID=G3B282_CANTC|nr:uncharacterized protein CANTEDRAFT_113394 [Yamadazyma tenuis ATCC 10573]XP_006685874.1 uncharacterized protein CANTEDRAFT_113394 [Yamadazyma tenuis ATCC 10573]EGV65067.1 hypothetical protein CANTEDRAFT_113394 [Yamadazyma tenuis ATCC 10573]EGV65068.1 hypothetical protein CANTEDRAFT_113394 [Yamadazyma tenuis ATCC 10573]